MNFYLLPPFSPSIPLLPLPLINLCRPRRADYLPNGRLAIRTSARGVKVKRKKTRSSGGKAERRNWNYGTYNTRNTSISFLLSFFLFHPPSASPRPSSSLPSPYVRVENTFPFSLSPSPFPFLPRPLPPPSPGPPRFLSCTTSERKRTHYEPTGKGDRNITKKHDAKHAKIHRYGVGKTATATMLGSQYIYLKKEDSLRGVRKADR